ncbi:hypothetical protein AGTUEHA105_LOCUS5295 [Agrobacterium tumefaciens]|nr:hypothetical protein AGTUEHA105_LOCUS5295 [Agrobacterium tumefaciens]
MSFVIAAVENEGCVRIHLNRAVEDIFKSAYSLVSNPVVCLRDLTVLDLAYDDWSSNDLMGQKFANRLILI